ncbi:MAG: nuclear transport factor 2 family protein [Micropepsaceae bacterium]
MRKFLSFAGVVSLIASAQVAQANPSNAARSASAGVDAVVERHMEAFLRRDWDKVILDYADDAVFVLPSGPIEGKPAILAFFHSLDAQKPLPDFKATLVPGVGNVGLEDWVMNPGKPGSLKGRDVFVIRDGKISVQTTIGLGPAAP